MKSIHSRQYQLFLGRLRAARDEAGMSQRFAAERLGETQAWIWKCEAGERRVDVIELLRFAHAYSKSVNYFLDALESRAIHAMFVIISAAALLPPGNHQHEEWKMIKEVLLVAAFGGASFSAPAVVEFVAPTAVLFVDDEGDNDTAPPQICDRKPALAANSCAGAVDCSVPGDGQGANCTLPPGWSGPTTDKCQC